MFCEAQTIKLPHDSKIYADTFAICWGKDFKLGNNDISKYDMRIEFETIFGDSFFTTETSDTLVSFPFIDDYKDEYAFHLHCIFLLRDSRKISGTGDALLKLLPPTDKIETLKLLASVNASIQNLQLLADAYEEEACYVNAYHIYSRMISIDVVKGKDSFHKFYQRNNKALPRSTHPVLR
jgi:hypothetical protein